MVRRRIVATALAVMALLMATTPARYWSSGTYEVARALAPRWAWAAAFAAVALALALKIIPRWLAAAVLAGHLTTWSLVLIAPVITGEAQSATAWTWPALVACLVLHTTRDEAPR